MTIALSYSFVRQSKTGKVFGMQVAILDLLRAYLCFSKQEKLPFLYIKDESRAEIEQVASECQIDPTRLVFHKAPFSDETLRSFTTIFRIDPMPGELLLARNRSGSNFTFCGLTHAMAGALSGRVLERYLLHPAHTGDAIVCPSVAIASALRTYWNSYEDYLAKRFDAVIQCPVDLPVIPLGVDVIKMTARCTDVERKRQRETLSVDDDTVLVLWVGRLSSLIKAHPIAMFRALDIAQRNTRKKVQFLMQGYFAPPEAENEFRSLAQAICPTVPVRFISNNHPIFPNGVWAASDIFLSLVDNMQESFGLTPIEAIAAGLPRVISDWDGYRDSVTHGQDGFLVPTTQPPMCQGAALSQMVLGGEDLYASQMAKAALCVAVDHNAAGKYLAELIQKPGMRHRIARAARARLSDYDWRNIIVKYENLWDEQNHKRCKDMPTIAGHRT